MIALEGVSKRYAPTLVALDDVSLAFSAPGIVSILGPNGAGKTTLFDLIAGTQRASAGRVRLFGEDPATARTVRRRLGVVMQDEFVLGGMRVREYAELFSAIYGIDDGVARILGEAGLSERRDAAVVSLSGGQAARLFIASALVHRPDVLLLDEPSAHLDPEGKRRLGDWLLALAHERLVLVSTHDLSEAERLSKRVVVLVAGKVRADGAPAALAERHGGFAAAYFDACHEASR